MESKSATPRKVTGHVQASVHMARTPRRVVGHVQSVVMTSVSRFDCFQQEETVTALTLLFEQYGEFNGNSDASARVLSPTWFLVVHSCACLGYLMNCAFRSPAVSETVGRCQVATSDGRPARHCFQARRRLRLHGIHWCTYRHQQGRVLH
jgi:hypothetical protein